MQILLNLHDWFQWAVLGSGAIASSWIFLQLLSANKKPGVAQTLLLIFLRSLEIQTALGGVIITWQIIRRDAGIPVLLHGLVGLLPVALLHWAKSQQHNWPERKQSRNLLFSVLGVLLLTVSGIFIVPEETLFSQDHVLEGHQEAVRSLAYSSDGKFLASGSFDGTIRIWDVPSGSLKESFNAHDDAIRSIAFSPDGDLLASVSFDQILKIRDLSSGEFQTEIEAHQASINKVLFSPSGDVLYTTSLDNRILMWDVNTGNLVREIVNNHDGGILSLELSEKAGLLTSGGIDGTIRVYDLQGEDTAYLGDHTGWVYDLAISPDGAEMASCSLDQSVKVWDLINGREKVQLDDCRSAVQTVTYSPDGEFLAAGCADNRIMIWKTGSYQLLNSLEGHQRGVLSLEFSPQADQLASGAADSTIILWKKESQ